MKSSVKLFSVFLVMLISINQALSRDGIDAKGSLDGAFSSWGRISLKGDWQIETVKGKTYIVLTENFRAKEGPDVKIFLSPLEASNITGENATEGSAFIHLVSDFEGANRIEIPADIDVSAYRTLVFHCEQYSVLWGVSPL